MYDALIQFAAPARMVKVGDFVKFNRCDLVFQILSLPKFHDTTFLAQGYIPNTTGGAGWEKQPFTSNLIHSSLAEIAEFLN